MKKMTFIVPTYKASHWIKKNQDFWIKVSKVVELIFIEDSLEEESKKIVSTIKDAKYISKKNGNWGSVINFVKNKNIIKTPYFAIVDADDVIKIDELETLISKMDNDDFYITDYIKKSLVTGKEKRHSSSKFGKNRTLPFVHSIWIATKMIEKMPDLPEHVFYADDLLSMWIYTVKDLKYKYLNLAPYIHYIDVDGQSISHFKKPKGDFLVNFVKYLDGYKFLQNIDKKSIFRRNAIEFLIYNLSIYFALSKNKESRKKIKNSLTKLCQYTMIPKSFILIWYYLRRMISVKNRKLLSNKY